MDIDCINTTKVPYSKTHHLPSIISDYVHSPQSLADFFHLPPHISSFAEMMAQRKPINREVLVEELTQQNKSASPQTSANIELLKQKNTFTVTTGHQICVNTGPLYFIYKIAGIIKLAQQLKEKYLDYNFVPIYWMATEDHDKEEINHFNLWNKKLTWHTPQTGAVGRFHLEDTHSFLRDVKSEFKQIPTEIETLLDCYQTENTLAQATQKIVHLLFGEYGIVTIDADNRALKKQALEVFKKELLTQPCHTLIENTNEKLVKKGYKPQINGREINLFYLEGNIRERIILSNGKYKVFNTDISFSQEEIVEELEKHPEKFSPNVALRPVYQEIILPNLAYTGGPGELAYWLQLKPIFDFFSVSFPILMPRNSLVLIKKSIAKKIKKLALAPQQLFLPTDELSNQYIKENTPISFENEIKELERVFDLAKEKAVNIDFTLEKTVIGQLVKAQNSINLIQKKSLKAEKRKHNQTLAQITEIKNELFPNNTMQERTHNLLSYYSPTLIPNIIQHIDAFEKSVYLLEV